MASTMENKENASEESESESSTERNTLKVLSFFLILQGKKFILNCALKYYNYKKILIERLILTKIHSDVYVYVKDIRKTESKRKRGKKPTQQKKRFQYYNFRKPLVLQMYPNVILLL